MALSIFIVLAIFSYHVTASPAQVTKNTIFIDEKLEGQIFEGIDAISTDVRSDNPTEWRLPNTTRPIHYDLLWEINIEELLFSGRVQINLHATQNNVNEIVLHAQYYEIRSLTLQQGTTTVAVTYELESENQFMRVRLTNGVLQYNSAQPVVYTLTVSFGASLRTEMNGLYRSWFRNSPSDEVSWISTTHFQATAARFAFPCYDEPSFKATFDISVTRPLNYKSWSCTRLLRTTTSSEMGYETDEFTRTPIMSTYLLALIVAEYDSLRIYGDNAQLKFEVIARPAAIATDQARYAHDTAQELTNRMSEHTGIDFYIMNENLKTTHAAIPDFSAGAMENWGLMIYREAYLMYDPEHTNDNYKQLIACILSHEIAHMWFGNLVTCEYWDNLWLNEGFARYYQYFLTDMVESNMGFQTRFITEQMHTALMSDSSNNPLPLTYTDLTTPASVRASMFSTITYNKGAAVIRMTEHLLGFDANRLGLQFYLNDRSYDVARPIDLFEALQRAADETGVLTAYGTFNFIDYYRSWTEQSGHPVLNVFVNRETGQITVTQDRFNINIGISNINTLYTIPLTFATARNPDFSDTKPTHIMNTKTFIIDAGTIGNNDWVIFNKQQTGFYRVNYDDRSWYVILDALRANRNEIHEYNRAQIVNDVFQFARSGLLNYTKALNILSYLEHERDYAPWLAAITGFQWLRNRFAVSPLSGYLDALIVRWATPLMDELTYFPISGESFMRSYLRWQLATFMCDMNVPACRTAAVQQFQALVNNAVEVSPNSRNWVYCNGLRDGSESDFNSLWQRYIQHNVYTEKIQLLQILGCSPHASSLNIFLSNIVEDNFVIRPQDYSVAFNSALNSNEENTQIVFEFIKNNMAATSNAFSGSLATPLSSVGARLRSIEEIDEFQAWITANQQILGNAFASAYSSAQSVRASIEWVAENEDEFYDYFLDNDIATTSAPSITEPPSTPEDITTTEEPDTITEAPDSAITSVLSVFALIISVAGNIVINY